MISKTCARCQSSILLIEDDLFLTCWRCRGCCPTGKALTGR